jgi:hypothetical protein
MKFLFSGKFFPFLYDVGLLPFARWIADTATIIAYIVANDGLAIRAIDQVLGAGCGFFTSLNSVHLYNLVLC